jgi:Phage tail lysozyme
MAAAPVSGSPARGGLPAGLAGLDPGGLAARPADAPLWPGETAPPPKPSSYPGMAGRVADQWREAGASENAVKGVLYNVNAESGFRPELRHPDQPRFSGEAHYAHGMYQHGGNQWYGLDRYSQQNDADWRDPKTQTAYEIANLQRTNPGLWRRMNEAPTWQDAAKMYARWLAPKQEYLDQRVANIDRSTDPLHGYTGKEGTGVGDRLPAGSTLTSGEGVKLTSDEGGTTTQKGGLGRLFTPENALRFGLAMLANPTPYVGTAIGQAGLSTLGAANEQERYEALQGQAGRKEAREERKLKLDEATKNARVKYLEDTHAEAVRWHNAQTAKAGQAELDRQMGKAPPGYRFTDPNDPRSPMEKVPGYVDPEARREAHEERIANKPPASYQWLDENDHSKGVAPIPHGPADPETIKAASAAKRPPIPGLSPEQEEIQARQIAGGNLSPLVGLPRTPEGLGIRTRLRQVASDIIGKEHPDWDPTHVAAYLNDQEQEFKGRQIGINSMARTAGNREANMELILRKFSADAPIALEANDRVTRYGGPITPLNRIIQRGEIMTSNPELVEFGMANLTLAEAWARAMNPTGVMRESDRDKALNFLDTALSAGTYKRGVEQLQRQITRELASIRSMDPRTPLNPNAPTPEPGAGAPTGGGGAATSPLDQARAAIKRGAPRDAVIKRLQEQGIDATGL